MGLKFSEVIGTYLLLGCNRLELEGWNVTVRLLPSADPTNSCSSSPSCKLQSGISANSKQQSFSNPTILTFNFYSTRENLQPGKDRKSGWKASSTTKKCLPIL